MTGDLFQADAQVRRQALVPGAVLLRGFADVMTTELAAGLARIVGEAPFRHMVTPSGRTMSVAMTNCGPYGWVTDRTGYRYDPIDPESGRRWPSMPKAFAVLSSEAAAAAGFDGFAADACLINRYRPGARLSLHQDKDERDFDQPIVSVSLGASAVFLFGGRQRTDRTLRVPVTHGDVLIWGGPTRLNYHGVLPVEPDAHPFAGVFRINLTLRKAA
jgi:alkylated DNA repair protein (DNA oxidative demethylase)